MYKHLPVSEKNLLVKRILLGEKITTVAREADLSRTILYKWIAIYKKTGARGKGAALQSNIKKGRKQWKSFNSSTERNIIKASVMHPTYGPGKIAKIVGVSKNGVWQALKRHGLNTQVTRTNYIRRNGHVVVPERSVADRIAMIRRFESGEKIVKICRDFKVSRTIYYQWLRKYQASDKNIEALKSHRPQGNTHWKFIPGAEELIINALTYNPQLSAHRISKDINQQKGVNFVGHSYVHTILKKHNLNTVEKRLAFVKSKQAVTVEKPKAIDSQLPAVPRYSFNSSLSPPQSRFFSSSFGVTASLCLIVILIPIVLLSSFLPADSFVQRIAYFIAFISLLCGLFFFLYSLKYYLSIAYVLSFSRREDRQGDGSPTTGSGFSRFLAGVFGVSISVEPSKTRVSENKGGVGLQADLSNVRLTRNPFVSVHVSTYNEKRVIDRLLTACTSFDYPNYEVVVADDSNDETVGLIEKWAHNPRVKISHRENREGYKGGALRQALRVTDPTAEFILVFDADFIP